eukprot:m.835770 g.835770  ORF g.835770 m.835770 type:complete len:365 (-) comp23455_c0_seq52:1342-2436(-)
MWRSRAFCVAFVLVYQLCLTAVRTQAMSGTPSSREDFMKMKVKQLKRFISDRGAKCIAEGGSGPCLDKQEYVDFAFSIKDREVEDAGLGFMEAKHRREKKDLIENGWPGIGIGNVRHLVGAEWESTFNPARTTDALILYYVPWCKHCDAIKRTFVDASVDAAKGSTADPKVKTIFVAIDCDDSKETCRKHKISKYPTIHYAEKKAVGAKSAGFETFKGDAAPEGILKYLKAKNTHEEWVNKPVWDENGNVLHITDAYYDEFKAKTPRFIVLFYASWCGYSRDFLPIFAEASTEAPKVTFAAIQCDEHPQACATISDMEGFPHVKFFEGHGESMVTFEGERSVEGLLDFVQENTFGLGVPQKQEL